MTCSEKACPFPADSGGLCVQHARMFSVPEVRTSVTRQVFPATVERQRRRSPAEMLADKQAYMKARQCPHPGPKAGPRTDPARQGVYERMRLMATLEDLKRERERIDNAIEGVERVIRFLGGKG